jgi:hypothetical protein
MDGKMHAATKRPGYQWKDVAISWLEISPRILLHCREKHEVGDGRCCGRIVDTPRAVL